MPVFDNYEPNTGKKAVKKKFYGVLKAYFSSLLTKKPSFSGLKSLISRENSPSVKSSSTKMQINKQHFTIRAGEQSNVLFARKRLIPSAKSRKSYTYSLQAGNSSNTFLSSSCSEVRNFKTRFEIKTLSFLQYTRMAPRFFRKTASDSLHFTNARSPSCSYPSAHRLHLLHKQTAATFTFFCQLHRFIVFIVIQSQSKIVNINIDIPPHLPLHT